jgi:hypothetical protein
MDKPLRKIFRRINPDLENEFSSLEDIKTISFNEESYKEPDKKKPDLLSSFYGKYSDEYSKKNDLYYDDKGSHKKKKKKKKKDDRVPKHLYNINYKADMITNEEGKPINKNDEDFYEMRYVDSLDLLNTTLNEIDELKKVARSDLDKLRESKQRGSLTAVTNQTANISSLLNTKINAIREINTVKKYISEFEIKRNKTSEESDIQQKVMMDQMFRRILNTPSYNDVIDIDNYEVINEDTGERIKKRRSELLENNELNYTEYEKNIELEKRDIETVVIMNPKNPSEWQFAAIDEDENIMKDYPMLPNPESVGNLTIDQEAGTARDKLNHVYKIFYY